MARVFISHSSRDNAPADRIKAWLQAQGFDAPFLDFDKHAGIAPGADWEKTLYREIALAEAVIVIQTSNWLESKWCFAEFTQARALGKPIFPVIETPTGQTLISPDIQALDLQVDREGGLAQLHRQLTQIALDAQGGFAWDATRAPFPGLLAFQEDDAAIYFGRDDDIRRLIERLNARRAQGGAQLIALLGASGSGKSSLLRAGVIPRLKRARRHWVVLPPMRPQGRPVDELARVLAVACAGTGGGGPDWRALRDRLNGENLTAILSDLASDLRMRAGANEAQILLPIDQAEELFGAAEPEQAERFMAILNVALAGDLPFLAVMALRSDYLGLLQSATHLDVRFEEFSLGPMPVARIAQIIEGPARVAGLRVDDAFVHQAMQDAQTEDALPLLAFALRELYDRSGGGKDLSLAAYQAMGDAGLGLSPLENAVRRAADQVLADARPGDDELAALRDAFVPAMVRVNDQGEYVRRPARWDDLPARAHPLLQKLAAARLLVMRQDGDARMVEVAHEALLRKWPRLRTWLDEARDFLSGRQQMEIDIRDWTQAAPADQDAALMTGLKLNRARGWLQDRPHQLTTRERGYVQASIAQADAEQARQLRRRRNTTRASLAASVVLAGVAGVAVWQWREALGANEKALRANKETETQTLAAGKAKDEALAQAAEARKAKDEAVPWIIKATWRSGADYKPQQGYVTGVRKLIEHADPIINLDKFRFLAPVPIFKSGPHGAKFNWDSTSFAQYNPDFVQWATDNMIPGAQDAVFREATRSVYQDHLSTLALAYCLSHRMLQNDPQVLADLKTDYLARVKAGTAAEFLRTPVLIDFSSAMDLRRHELNQGGVFSYYAHVAGAFWVRREADGTAARFNAAITKLITAYDPATAKSCAAVKRPFSAAMADAFPGTWRLGPMTYASFAADGGLSLRRGQQVSMHRWAFAGPGRLLLDAVDATYDAAGSPIAISRMPSLQGAQRLHRLDPEQPWAGSDSAESKVDGLNANRVETSLGLFSRTDPGQWRGPGMGGGEVAYREIGRRGWVIYLFDEQNGAEVELWQGKDVKRATAPPGGGQPRVEVMGKVTAFTRVP